MDVTIAPTSKFCICSYKEVKSSYGHGLPNLAMSPWWFQMDVTNATTLKFCICSYKEVKSSYGHSLPNLAMSPWWLQMDVTNATTLKFCICSYKEVKSFHSHGLPNLGMSHGPSSMVSIISIFTIPYINKVYFIDYELVVIFHLLITCVFSLLSDDKTPNRPSLNLSNFIKVTLQTGKDSLRGLLCGSQDPWACGESQIRLRRVKGAVRLLLLYQTTLTHLHQPYKTTLYY